MTNDKPDPVTGELPHEWTLVLRHIVHQRHKSAYALVGELLIERMQQMHEDEFGAISDDKMTVAIEAAIAKREWDDRQNIISQAKRLANQEAVEGEPLSEKDIDRLSRWCDYLGKKPSDFIEDVSKNEYLKMSMERFDKHEEVLIEVLGQPFGDGVPQKYIEAEWKRKGLPPTMLNRTKKDLSAKMIPENLTIVSERKSDGFYWRIAYLVEPSERKNGTS